MNILIVLSSLNYGGAEKQVIVDANMLCKKNNVFLLTFQKGPLAGLLNKDIPLIILKKYNYLITAFRIALIIRKNKISVVHAHLFAPMVISAFAGLIMHTPVVWNFHTHAYRNHPHGKRLHRFSAKLPSVKKILFPAEELIHYYQSENYGFDLNKIQLVYNSGQSPYVSQARRTADEDGEVNIGYIGRVIEIKRVHLLVELAEQLIKNGIVRFYINVVGDGPEMKNIKQSVNEKHITDYIKFHGFQDDTVTFLNQFDIFVLPSEEEVLSLSLIDAGMSGLPCVAFNIGGNSEIIIDGYTGYLVTSKEEFNTRIINLIRNSPLRRQLGANAHELCNSKFSPESRVKNLTAIYEEFV